MYAIIRAKGHQYKVEAGDVIKVPHIAEADVGDKIVFSEVLFIGRKENDQIDIGRPLISNAAVQTEVLAQEREKKVIAFKKARRTGFHKKHGHRTQVTRLKVLSIEMG